MKEAGDHYRAPIGWRSIVALLTRAPFVLVLLAGLPAHAGDAPLRMPVLVYHRVGPMLTDTMTVTTPVFEAQLQHLQTHGHQAVALRDVVASLRGTANALPARAVAISVDDGHRSVYTDLFPLLRRFRTPVTLFIYPSAISNASYAMTWEQLAELKASGLVDVQSHSFWHPNFAVERRRLTPDAYQRFAQDQLTRSKTILQQRLGGTVDLLAWPFGLYDTDLMQWAAAAGYVAAFSIERRPVTREEALMALPRYIVTDADRGGRLEALLSGLPSAGPAPGMAR
jgi:peptidoglycan/xylan/chitin deacetylase (PgdA/CDA1 family)